ncbi:MAG TPA: hypothetical protein VKP64_05920 [Mycobacteriales bacterium]|nr:hypothetical protein [Mycobacteriales bacterium]
MASAAHPPKRRARWPQRPAEARRQDRLAEALAEAMSPRNPITLPRKEKTR